MNAKHTPGPWESVSRSMSDGTLVVKDSEYNEICVIRDKIHREYGPSNDTDIANSCIIAAAPDLLAALESVTLAIEQLVDIKQGSPVAFSVRKARAAIAKARGEL